MYIHVYIIVSFLYFVTNVTFCFTRDVTRLWPATPLPDRQIYRLMYDSVTSVVFSTTRGQEQLGYAAGWKGALLVLSRTEDGRSRHMHVANKTFLL